MNIDLLGINAKNFEFSKNKSILSTVKPFSYKNNKDIDLKNIFKIMKEKIIKAYKSNQFLNIELTDEQKQKRFDIIMIIKNFIIENSININIFYDIIHFFDLLIIKNNKHKYFTSLEKIGLGALFISIKFLNENNNNSSISIKKYKSLYNNRYFSLQEISKIEFLCLKLINYNLIQPWAINFIEFFIMNGILFNTDINSSTGDIFQNYFIFNQLCYLIFKNIETIMIYTNEYIKYNPIYLSLFIVGFSRNMLNMEKFPKHFNILNDLIFINYNDKCSELLSKFKNILNNNNKRNKRFNSKKTFIDSKYLNDYLKIEEQSLQNSSQNNHFELFKLESTQNLSFIKHNNNHYLNPFLENIISLKNAKNNNEIKDAKKKLSDENYSSHVSKQTIFLNKTKNKFIYKFNPFLYEQYVNSSSNNIIKNTLVKSKTSTCIKRTKDEVITAIKYSNSKNLGEKEKISEEKKDENTKEEKINFNYSYKKYLKKNKQINITNNNNQKVNKNLNIEVNNKYKFIKYKSSVNCNKNKKSNSNKNCENEKVNNNEGEKKHNNLISIRSCYKIKQKNYINDFFKNENDNKNNEEKNIKMFSFKKRLTENISLKLNEKNSVKNKIKINQINNETSEKLEKISNDLENINNKRVHIRMYYKLKNLKIKNRYNYNKYFYA